MGLIKKLQSFFTNTNRNYVVLTQITNAIIALITGKLIAVYISPADFGNYNIQFAAYTFFLTILISPFIQFIKTSNKTFLPKIGTTFYLYTLSVLILIAYIALASFLYFYYKHLDISLYVILFFFLLFSVTYSVIADFLNIQNRIVDFSKMSILKVFGGLIFIGSYFFFIETRINDVLVLWFMQLFGLILGLFFFGRKYKLFETRFKIGYSLFLKKYLHFGAPLMFLALWAWINNYFDRYAIEYFLSLEDVGIYNASYGVGSKVFLLVSPIFIILLTPTVFSALKRQKKKEAIKRYALVYVIIAVPILVVIYFLKDFLGFVLLSENYKEGFFLIFWIGLAFFIFTLSQLFDLYFYAELKTNVMLWGHILAAIVNIVLNVFLIPKYGILGSALATIIGFSSYLALIWIYFKYVTFK